MSLATYARELADNYDGAQRERDPHEDMLRRARANGLRGLATQLELQEARDAQIPPR